MAGAERKAERIGNRHHRIVRRGVIGRDSDIFMNKPERPRPLQRRDKGRQACELCGDDALVMPALGANVVGAPAFRDVFPTRPRPGMAQRPRRRQQCRRDEILRRMDLRSGVRSRGAWESGGLNLVAVGSRMKAAK